MKEEEYVTKTFERECEGRDGSGKKVLQEPIAVKIEVHKSPDSRMISSLVDCPHNVGAHGQRCKASHPNQDKVGYGINCRYSFDYVPISLEGIDFESLVDDRADF